MAELLTLAAFGIAVFSALMFVVNFFCYRRAPVLVRPSKPPAVSVLIPARNEASRIEHTLNAILATNDNVEATHEIPFEVVVLDDQSQDRTAEVIERIASSDNRLRLIRGDTLPVGWCGKQFACHQLSNAAKYDEWLFLDADVTLSPDALSRIVNYKQINRTALLSGFPRQIIGSLGEALLIPLIHVVLLTYLPFGLMRRTKMQAASAGCGQLFLTNRADYSRAGGHKAIRASLHDGVTLPRAYRQAGLTTDVFDAADLASCRMYRGWSQTWQGLAKNAHEGIANLRLIGPFTIMMTVGFVGPLVAAVYWMQRRNPLWLSVALVACIAAYIPRLITSVMFEQSIYPPLPSRQEHFSSVPANPRVIKVARKRIRVWTFLRQSLAVVLFPLSIILFLALQWKTLASRLQGSQPQWRGRVVSVASTTSTS